MQFNCKTINLKNALLKTERIVSKQITLPVLGNILLGVERGMLVVSSTNLEMAIKIYLGGKIEKEGQITVPARILSGFLSSVEDEVIEGELIGEDLVVRSRKHKLKIKGMDAKEFPIIPEFDGAFFFKIKADVFGEFISNIMISVAHNDTRQELNGVLVRFFEDSLIFASTDSFRLSEVKIKLDKKDITEEYLIFIKSNPSVILPAMALMEIQKVFEKGEVEIKIDQNQFFAQNKEAKIVSRLIDGNYPEYQQILPEKYETTIKINKNELLSALKIAFLVAGSQNGEVSIKNKEDKKGLVLTSQSMDSGENVSEIAGESTGSDFEMIFNCRYFLEGLNGLMSDKPEIVLKVNKKNTPVCLKGLDKQGKEKDEMAYIIMPIVKD